MRWEFYKSSFSGDAVSFWKKRLSTKRNVAFVLGLGFDPRTCQVLKTFREVDAQKGQRKLFLTRYPEGPDSPSRQFAKWVDINLKSIVEICGDVWTIEKKVIKQQRRLGRPTSRTAFVALDESDDLGSFDDIVIDVSALPRELYFAILTRVLYLNEKSSASGSKSKTNVFVLIAESSELDCGIVPDGLEENARFYYPYGGREGQDSVKGFPCVWLPMIGEGQTEQFRIVRDLVQPDEICPLIPSPSMNPRKCDELILEHRVELFEESAVEVENIVLVSEDNPFEAYRRIRETIEKYTHSLRPIGGARFVLTPLGSKLMSLGMLLSAYESRWEHGEQNLIGLAGVGSKGYRATREWEPVVPKDLQIRSLWIEGDYYSE